MRPNKHKNITFKNNYLFEYIRSITIKSNLKIQL